uniref:Uncharacterized protein n=1 Tax=Pararge aegeria TaxID=116150 RepID=S4PEF2_9NEOP
MHYYNMRLNDLIIYCFPRTKSFGHICHLNINKGQRYGMLYVNQIRRYFRAREKDTDAYCFFLSHANKVKFNIDYLF